MRVPNAPLPSQAKLIDRVLETIQHGQVLTVFAHGAPGTGKSTLAQLMAARIPVKHDENKKPSAVVVRVNPLDSSQNVLTLIRALDERYDTIVIEIPEADKLLLQTDKPETKPMWNGFFDYLRDSVPDANLVVLISCNISLLDVVAAGACFSCVRLGRVHLECELGADADTTLVRDALSSEEELMAGAPAEKHAGKHADASGRPTNRRRTSPRARKGNTNKGRNDQLAAY
jgi:hypothetical protein